jgi:integrative conjugative element protein, RAQPRD family
MKQMLIGIVFFCLSSMSVAQSEVEREQLKMVLEQLNNIEQVVLVSEQSSQKLSGQRYNFDYEQFKKDLEAIRTGVELYLTPVRAQPREVVDFEANYRKEKK